MREMIIMRSTGSASVLLNSANSVTSVQTVNAMNTNVGELVALDGAGLAMDEAALKHLAMLFPRIAVPALPMLRSKKEYETAEFAEARIQLINAGVLFEPDKDATPPARPETFNVLMRDWDEILKPVTGADTKEFIAARKDEKKLSEIERNKEEFNQRVSAGEVDFQKLLDASKRMSTNQTRLLTAQLKQAENLDVCAVIPAEFISLDEADDEGHDVMKIVLTSLPAPSDDVSWEQIIEYRSDPESFKRFRELKDWMTDTARGKLTPGEVREKLEFLLDQYRKHFQSRRMNTVNATLAAFIVSSTDALRNLTTVRWGKAESMFTIERRRLALLAEESTSEGSVVAFVLKTEIFDWQ
jgi:hypothetical protein